MGTKLTPDGTYSLSSPASSDSPTQGAAKITDLKTRLDAWVGTEHGREGVHAFQRTALSSWPPNPGGWVPIAGTIANQLTYITVNNVTTNGTTHVVTSDAFAGVFVGQNVTGVNVPANTIVSTVTDSQNLILSNTVAAGTTTLTFEISSLMEYDGVHWHPFSQKILPGSVGAGTITNSMLATPPAGGGTPVTQAFGDAPAPGSGPAYSFFDHKHGMPAAPTTFLQVGGIFKLLMMQVTSTTQLKVTFWDCIVQNNFLAPTSSLFINGAGGPYTLDNTQSGANGLDTGSLAASTWYHVWVIYNSGSPAIAVLLSVGNAAPTMPTGYTHKAYVGPVWVDAAKHFFPILQTGKSVVAIDPITVATAWSAVLADTVGAYVSVGPTIPSTMASFTLNGAAGGGTPKISLDGATKYANPVGNTVIMFNQGGNIYYAINGFTLTLSHYLHLGWTVK